MRRSRASAVRRERWATWSGWATRVSVGLAERADDVVEADAGEAHLGLGLVSGRGDEDDRGVGPHDLAGVLGEAAAEADVDRPAQVPGGEGRVVAGVEHDGARPLLGEHLVEGQRRAPRCRPASRSRCWRLRLAANAKYSGATDWPWVTASTNSSSLIGASA